MRISIEGNIGSGKTTQLEMLREFFPIFTEPVHLWPLDSFYEDPKRQGFHMQSAVLASFADYGPGIYERSTRSSRDVFSNLEGSEKFTYDLLYHRLGWDPDYWIFLESDPELCYKRIQGRKVPGDTHVTLEYIKQLDDRYKQFYDAVKDRAYIVNADRPKHEVYKSIQDIVLKHWTI